MSIGYFTWESHKVVKFQ